MFEWLNANAGAVGSIMAMLLTVFTAVYVFLTWKLLRENKQLREQSFRPQLAIRLIYHKDHMHILGLLIQNIGSDAARSISLQADQPFKTFGDKDLSNLGPFKSGIALLAPHQSFDLYIANSIGRWDDLVKRPLTIRADWQDSIGNPFTGEFRIDFAEYEHVSRIGTPPLKTIADATSEIKKSIGHLASGWNKLHVVTQTDKEEVRTDRISLLIAQLRGLPESDAEKIFHLANEAAKNARTNDANETTTNADNEQQESERSEENEPDEP